MGQTERLARLQNWLGGGRCLSVRHLMETLEVSHATLKRDIAMLRERFNMPVVFDRQRGGWRLDNAAQLPGTQYELPHLWMTSKEIHALLTMQHLLSHLDADGLLGRHVEPLKTRLLQLLGKASVHSAADLARRIRVQTVGARQLHLPHFQAVGSALLQRRRLVIHYHARGGDVTSEREISPQRLIHYRDNWYLDAWCHLRKALRSFSLDAMRQVHTVDKAAIDVADTELDDTLGSGYGIFAGKEVTWARLRFTPERAKWVAAERWHPNQRGRFDEHGYWLLDVPYADARELVMDILRHVPHVTVMWPEELEETVRGKLEEGLRVMGAG